MKSTEKTRDTWYHLDNAANLFPAVSSEENTNVFRLACELREPVDPGLLQAALDTAMEAFPYFRVVMRRGLFWFYLERTNLNPIVELEQERPCSRLFYKNVKELLFRVSYFERRVNLEVFHAVSDGAGAFDLLRAIIYHYLLLVHGDGWTGEPQRLDREPPPTQQSEDSFRYYYDSSERGSPFKKRAFAISGTLLPPGVISVISATMPTEQILTLAKAKNATITAYLGALMISAIHSEMMPGRAESRSIGINIPVDLRGHFVSESSRNFFSVIDVSYNFAEQGGGFDEVLASISGQLRDKLESRELSRRINYNMAVQRNILVRFTPLFLKNLILRAAYHSAESATTAALSNLGRITMPAPFDAYIERFSCLLNPTRIHRWKACVCSYGDEFMINFTSVIAETKLHKYLLRHLSAAGVDVCITCNGVNEYEIL